ncbi:hypothetical protein ACTXT7_016408 [Hymenolepis weldensis]
MNEVFCSRCTEQKFQFEKNEKKSNKQGDRATAHMLKVVPQNFGKAANRKLDRKSQRKLVISGIKPKVIESPEGTSEEGIARQERKLVLWDLRNLSEQIPMCLRMISMFDNFTRKTHAA